ncbi:MAG: PH domain-containing protein [Nanoarchaeota archaeon]
MENLYPRVKNAWRIIALFPTIIISIFGGIGLSALFNHGKIAFDIYLIVEFIVSFIIIYIIALILIGIYYNNFLFDFRKDGIYIEKGIITKKYNTIPYSKIQNVDMRRTIFGLMFGFSELSIQTAGYSANIIVHTRRSMENTRVNTFTTAEGYIPGLAPERAEQLREWLMKKVSK